MIETTLLAAKSKDAAFNAVKTIKSDNSQLLSAVASETKSKSEQLQDKIDDLRLKETTLSVVKDTAKQAQDVIDQAVSSIYDSIKLAIDEFKKVPPMLKKAVDIDGAANGVYEKFNEFIQQTGLSSNVKIISSEVPIVSSDYYAKPSQYPNLLQVQYQNNIVTDDDCISSGYKKIQNEISCDWKKSISKYFPIPVEDSDIVQKKLEQMFNVSIKTVWDNVGPMVNTVGNLAHIDTIQNMVQGVTKAIDGIVKLMSTPIDEQKLDEKLALQDAQKEKQKNETELAKNIKGSIGQSFDSVISAASAGFEQAKNQVEDVASGMKDTVVDAFKNLKMPEMPDDIKKTFSDLQEAIVLVMNNISNIYIVLILTLLGKILDCFKQILDVIGVPNLPDPLGKLPQLITESKTIMSFVMGLPVTFMNCVKSIAKKKVKAMQIANMPTPPEPIQTKVPIPPTSKDVVKPDVTWDDIKKTLKEKYEFSEKDSDSIVNDIKEFYDGSDKNEYVIVGGIDDEVGFEETDKTRIEYGPDSKVMKRLLVTPVLCYDSWLNQHIYSMNINGEKCYGIDLPHKGEYGNNIFYEYEDYNTKKYYNASKDFGMHCYNNKLT